MEKIFISLAAYRDEQLPLTIDSCLKQAAHPERLVFGINHQYDPVLSPIDTLDQYKNDNRFRIIQSPCEDSIGSADARYKVQQLYNNEEYTLSVDTHSRFDKDWDKTLIDDLNSKPCDKPLISCFPTGFFYIDGKDVSLNRNKKNIPNAIVKLWSEFGWIDVRPEKSIQPGSKTRFLFLGFIFTKGIWNIEVQNDPQHYYTGEEFALAIRSWTHGYDLFFPSELCVYHLAEKVRTTPRNFDDIKQTTVHERSNLAYKRLRDLLDGNLSNDKFGPGNVRTVDSYLDYAGLKWPERQISKDALEGNEPQ